MAGSEHTIYLAGGENGKAQDFVKFKARDARTKMHLTIESGQQEN